MFIAVLKHKLIGIREILLCRIDRNNCPLLGIGNYSQKGANGSNCESHKIDFETLRVDMFHTVRFLGDPD
jgi:hypothetical protein